MKIKAVKSEKNENNRIKVLFVVALCCLAIALGIRQSIAAYISISNMKAVASTNENESLFNSNYLYGYKSVPSPIATNTIEVNGEGSNVSFTVYIFNHHKQDINLVSQSDITYNLDIKVTGNQGDLSYYKVNGNSVFNSSGEYSISNITLKGRKAATNNYTITMPTNDLDYAQIQVMATVQNVSGGTGTNIHCLAAILAPSKRSQVASPSVEGTLIEKGDLTKYDAYNYEITVGGNASEVELKWNRSIVEIDPFFAREFGISGNPGTARLTLPIGTRVIQFYRVGSTKPSSDQDLDIEVTKASS